MNIRKRTIVIILLVVLSIFTLIYWKKIMHKKTLYRLDEPMLISSSKGEPYYMLPTNTVLRLQQGFSEGHQLYTIQVFAKGKLPASEINESTPTESTWIYPIDRDDVTKILSQYPLPKDDLIRILKAHKMTRDDLAHIVREWKDD